MSSTFELRRRHVLASGAAAAFALPMLRSAPARADEIRLRATWWGSQERIRRTTADFDLYHQLHPDVTLVGQPAGGDYWTKIATQVAGRDLADVFQLDANSLSDYSSRGAALQLDKFIPKPLDVAAFGPQMLALGQTEGKTWGVAEGINAYAIVYDADVLQGVGLNPPNYQTTWAELADLAVEITRKVNKPNYWGLADGSGHYYAIDTWLIQRGKTLYKGRGLGFTADDAAEWFDYWADMRKRGGCVPADVASMDDGQIPTTPIARGTAALDIEFSNYLTGYQALTKNHLSLAALPNGDKGAKPGLFYRPALIWSVASTSRNPEAAAAFISWFVTSPESAKIIGVERGVPVLRSVRDAIAPGLTASEQIGIDYLNGLQDKVGTYVTPPAGTGEFDRMVLRPTAQMVAFGKLSSAEGAKKLIADAKSVF
jgi:multiple sugar transport system substrate-binding protein